MTRHFPGRMMADDGRFQCGDALYFHGEGVVSFGINCLTWGWPFRWPAKWAGFSHVATIGFHPHNPLDVALYESTTGSQIPCLFADKSVSGVACRPIAARVAEYRGQVWHYPLTPAAREFYNEEAAQAFLWQSLLKPYDYHQAFHAQATLLGALLRRCCRHDPAAQWYCSEHRTATLRAGLGNFPADQLNPNRLFRRERRMMVIGEGRRLR